MDAPNVAKRPAIADIIRGAGAFDAPGSSRDVFSDLAAMTAAAVPGASAAQMAVGEALAKVMTERFHIAQSKDTTEGRDFAVPYETLGRATILTLHKSGAKVGAASDTATGAALEAKMPLTILSPEIGLTLAITDVAPNASRLSGTSHHVGLDWMKLNAKTLDDLFAGIDGYLTRFAS